MKTQLTLILLLLIGCKDPTVLVDDTPAALDTDKSAENNCYKDCLKSSQARAVAWEQVERDCAASCDDDVKPALSLPADVD